MFAYFLRMCCSFIARVLQPDNVKLKYYFGKHCLLCTGGKEQESLLLIIFAQNADETFCDRSPLYAHRSLFLFSPTFFVLPTRHLTSPNVLCYTSLVDVVCRVRGRPRVAPSNGVIAVALAGGVGTRPRALGDDPGQNCMGSPGRRPFLRHCMGVDA